jgi:hypothetical protein
MVLLTGFARLPQVISVREIKAHLPQKKSGQNL